MLRITPLSIDCPTNSNTGVMKLRPAAHDAGGNFGEKDERRVNEVVTSRLQQASVTRFFYVPFGLTRRVGIALAGSSGQG
jgi:hypothetical protein